MIHKTFLLYSKIWRTKFPNNYSEQLFKTDYTEQKFVCQYFFEKFPNNFSEYMFAIFCKVCYNDKKGGI